ncbi:hypothetical protein [Dictyobacter kobayashii]|uniref:Uncharacterized protein n=1 Tax=Dictyobacter kobayashii TaxID=2014872 RepID=A0A402AHU1_9CHLR|nr:hypothetical protein [Dictyobacter kobayashii]GCE18625.1 hypothetical protein KDK_24250 [Dictyobacter kobayashii]
MSRERYIALALEMTYRQLMADEVDIWSVGVEQARDAFQVYIRLHPASPLVLNYYMYGLYYTSHIGLLWPAFLHSLYQNVHGGLVAE